LGICGSPKTPRNGLTPKIASQGGPTSAGARQSVPDMANGLNGPVRLAAHTRGGSHRSAFTPSGYHKALDGCFFSAPVLYCFACLGTFSSSANGVPRRLRLPHVAETSRGIIHGISSLATNRLSFRKACERIEIAGGIRANKPFHVTAALLRLLLNPKRHSGAAARDR